MLSGRRILLGVTGSIAAYKSVSLLRRLAEQGADVTVVMTDAAKRFVGPLTFQTLSGHPVYDDPFDPREEILHLTLADAADVFLIAPATANTIAKLAAGAADDLVSALALSARCPVILAPAMDAVMWEHRLVQRNLEALRAIGVTVVLPETGALASGLVGPGRLASEEALLAAVDARVGGGPWSRERVVVTAGPTSEPIDPVRTITNRSSGKMGYALADAARRRGAAVTLISGPTKLAPPVGVEVVAVDTAAEMQRAVLERIEKATVLIMAAAVADFRPAAVKPAKIKKTVMPLTIELTPTEDILKAVAERRSPDLFVVGFAAETDRVVERAGEKLKAKHLDLIVANDVSIAGIGFGADENEVTMIDRRGDVTPVRRLVKSAVAERILDRVEVLRTPRSDRSA
jgi:phosphopantothenoylcysteine decarboxylase/phosphopantothenate--cysteine ligase